MFIVYIVFYGAAFFCLLFLMVERKLTQWPIMSGIYSVPTGVIDSDIV